MVGNSHVAAFVRAADARRENVDGARRICAIHVRDEKYRPELVAEGGMSRLNDLLVKDILLVKASGAQMISCVGGNRHNVVGLMKHSRPFDFVLPRMPGLPLHENFELVPAVLIESLIRTLIEKEVAILSALRQLDPDLIHIESPPPVKDSDFVMANAGVYFDERGIGASGVNPPWIRYKLWRLYSEIIKQVCEGLGIRFHENPREVVDANGFLVPRAIQDATHANAWYAERVIFSLKQYRSRSAGQ